MRFFGREIELKIDASRFDATRLAEKVEAFFAKNPDKRNLHYKTGLLSIEDM